MFKKQNYIVCSILAGVIVLPLIAQNRLTNFQHITVKDGLASNEVRQIFQDKKGFIWFCTASALQRFDGYDFRTYQLNSNNLKTSISNNSISCALPDTDGNIWVGTEGGGLNYFNQQTETFSHFSSETDTSLSFYANRIIDILADKSGNVWVTTLDGFYKVDKQHNKLLPFSESKNHSTQLDGRVLSKVAEDKNGMLWIGSQHGINMYDPINDIFYNRKNNPRNLKIFDKQDIATSYVFINKQGLIWVGNWFPGLFSFDQTNNTLKEYDLYSTINLHDKREVVSSMIEDEKGNFLITTLGMGLLNFNSNNGKYEQCSHDDFNPNSISSFEVYNVFQDREKNCWVGTSAGADHFNPSLQSFTNIHTNGNNYRPDNLINSFTKDKKGNIWIANVSLGLCELDSNYNTIARYAYKGRDNGVLPFSYINKILMDKETGNLWIASNYGFYEFNLSTKKAILPFDNNLLKQSIRYIYKDDKNTFWLATSVGTLIRYDKLLKSVESYSMDRFIMDKKALEVPVTFITDGKSDDLWISAEQVGLLHFDKKSKSFIECYKHRKDINSLPAEYVQNIKRIANKLYIGLYQYGLSVMDLSTHHFSNYTVSDGLPDHIVSGIFENSKGSIWLTTGNGITRMDTITGKFRNYTLKDGILDSDFGSGAFYKNKDCSFTLAAGAYLVLFNPEKIRNYPDATPPQLLSVVVYDKKISFDSLFEARQPILIPYNSNLFTVQFASLDYINPQQIQYAYFLKGIDNNWNYCGNRRNISYANLPGGNYTLLIKCANADGVWSENTSIPIFVTTPFYKTGIFICFIVVLLTGMIFLIIRIYARRKLRIQKMEFDKQREIENIRSRISQDIHDDIGSGLTKISILSQLVKKGIDINNKETPKTLDKIIASSKEITGNLSEIVWTVNPIYDNLDSLLSYMRTYAYNYFDTTEIDCKINFPDDVPPLSISPDLKRNLFLILKEVLQNVMKHSKARSVSIQFIMKDNEYILSIMDNGIGMDKKNTREFGNGLRNITKRAESSGASLSIVSDIGKGTKIVVEGKVI